MFTIEETALRAASEDDAAAVAELYAGYVTGSVANFEIEPPTIASWQAKIRAERLPFVVLTREDELLGFACAAPWRGYKPAYLHTIETTVYVGQQHAGRGLGRLLLSELVARCTVAGYRQAIAVITVDDADTGAASVALHRAVGFEAAGRLRAIGYKHGRWLDTMLMQRSL